MNPEEVGVVNPQLRRSPHRAPRTGEGAPAPAADGRHLGYGGLAVSLLALGVVLSSLASRLVDGARLRTDSHGTSILVESGNTGGLVGTGLMLLGTGCAGLALLTALRTRPAVSTFGVAIAVLIGWWAVAVTLFQPSSLSVPEVVTVACGAVLAFGVLAAPPTMRVVQHLDLLRDVTAVALLLFAFLLPHLGQLPCRPDKCGVFGSLLTGFTLQENTAASMIALFVPLIAAQPSMRRRVFSIGVATLLVLGTGSRTALAVLAVSVLYTWHSGRSERVGATKPLMMWRALPLTAFLASTALFYVADPGTLTGRGLLYVAMRAQLDGIALLIGSGPETMERAAFFLGGFTVAGEHGQAPHLLVMTGLIGWSLFALALLTLIRATDWSPRRRIALGLALAAAVQGLTEPAWMLEVRTPGFVSALLAAGLMCTAGADAIRTASAQQSTPNDSPPRPVVVRQWR